MGSHPANLSIRFLPELVALVAMARWGWLQGHAFDRYLFALAVPAVAMVSWATFAVPGDPSRSGNAPMPVPGAVRIALEALIFGFAIFATFASGHASLAIVFAAITTIHYAVSYDRLAWLLRR